MVKMHKVDLSHVDFVFFDKGGTLGGSVPQEDGGVAKAKELIALLGYSEAPEDFIKKVNSRQKKYKAWSLETCYEETVEKMCSDWLYFDAPNQDVIKERADEIIIMTTHMKGRRYMCPEAAHVVGTIRDRGYRVGLISNTVSPTMVPRELENAGLDKLFEVVVMSSVERLRKPDPAIFTLACERAGIDPSRCAYIGDAPNRDVEGPRRAGFDSVVIIAGANYNPESDIGPMREPDAVVDTLEDLFELFPAKGGCCCAQ